MNQNTTVIAKPKNPYCSSKGALLGCIMAIITVYDAVRCDKKPETALTLCHNNRKIKRDKWRQYVMLFPHHISLISDKARSPQALWKTNVTQISTGRAHRRNEHTRSTAKLCLTIRLLISYIYGAPSKARNANIVYIWTYVWQRWNSLCLFAAQCFNTESMQRGFLCHICV